MSMALPQAQSSTSAPPKTSQAPPLPSKLGSLPAELLDNVLSFLDPESLIQASHTCRVLRSVYVNHNKSLWCAMAFSHPESTGKKHFKYVTWVENILLSEDNYEIRTALEMDLPRFHNRFLNTHLSFRQENMVTPRLQWELNRLAVIDTILTYLGKPINPAARFYWFEIDLHIDDFDPYVSDWYPIEGYDYDKHEETMVEIAKELMGVLESLGWIQGSSVDGDESDDEDDARSGEMFEELYECLKSYGIGWLGGLYQAFGELETSEFPNDITDGHETVEYATPVISDICIAHTALAPNFGWSV